MSGTPSGRWPEVRRAVGEIASLPPEQRERHLCALPVEIAAEVRALLAADDPQLSNRLEAAVGRGAVDWLTARDAAPVAGLAQPAEAAGAVVGAWRLERPLGRGGMAEVWEASRADGAYEQRVAVKLLKRGMDSDELVARFRRERQILARLEHPSIARLLDGGVAPDGRLFLVLEKVDGEPITAWAQRRGLDLAQRLRLLVEVCQVVAAAHRQLVVHRDLKPSNILVSSEGRVKLLDFGIAKLLDDDEADSGAATRSEVRVLTPAYAAPEQILGRPVSTATDVYALGVLGYELVTGALPHRRARRGLGELASSVESESVALPSQQISTGDTSAGGRQLARSVRGDLDTILLKALERDPGRRYATVGELAEDLERFLERRPISARRASAPYRLARFVRRHRLAAGGAALLAAALASGFAATLWQAERARRNALEAEVNARRAERVQHLLVEVFRGADPGRALGEEPTAREILESGVAHLDRQLESEPAVAADLYDVLAEIHHELGQVERATELARRALRLREERLPRDPARLSATLRRLASIGIDGDLVDVLPNAERAWRLAVEGGGAESVDAAVAESELAYALYHFDRPDEGVERQRHAVEVLRKVAGRGSVEAAGAEVQLAEMLESSDRFEEAEQLYRDAVQVLEGALGSRHPLVAAAKRDFAGLLDRLGRTREAEPLLAAALAAQRAVLGDTHWQVAETMFSYALLLRSLGRYEEAGTLLAEALAVDVPALLRAHLLRYSGLNLADQGRHEEAVGRLREAVAAYRAIEGADSIEGWRAAANLGYLELRAGRAQRAERELREAVAALERLSGAESYQVRLPLRQLGETLRERGAIAEALEVLRRTREIEVKLFGTEDHPDLATTDYQLALTLRAAGGAGELAEADRRLAGAIALLERHKPASPLLAEARRALAGD